MSTLLVWRFSVGGAGVIPGRARSVGFSREDYFIRGKGLDEGAENLTGFRHGPNLDGSLPRIKEKAIMTYRFGLKD